MGEIKVPVLLGHGLQARAIPYEHARRFIAAAKRVGARVEHFNYPDEGAAFVQPRNEADFLERVERFLSSALPPPPEPPQPSRGTQELASSRDALQHASIASR